jgi:hypothetical protein
VEGEGEAYMHIYTRFLIRDAIIFECRETSIRVMWGLIIVSNSRGQMAPPDSKKKKRLLIRKDMNYSSKYVSD